MEESTVINTDNADVMSDVTAKATAGGWKPLEQYDGDPDRWVDAKEFIGRAPLYEQNHKLKKEISDLKNIVHEVKGHITKVSEAAYNKAVRELSAQRDEAIDNGDRDQVKEIDKALKDAESVKVTTDTVHPAIRAWEADNGEWFYADKEVSNFGLTYAQNYLDEKPGDFAGAMVAMEKALKKGFPEKFEQTADKRKDPPAVESGGRSGGKKSFTEADLDDESRKVMNKFVRTGLMTKEDYIKELADSGVLGGRK